MASLPPLSASSYLGRLVHLKTPVLAVFSTLRTFCAHSCSSLPVVSPTALFPAQICLLSSRPFLPNASTFQCRCFMGVVFYTTCPAMDLFSYSLLLISVYSHPNSEQHHNPFRSQSQKPWSSLIVIFLHALVFTSRSY